MQHRLGRLQSLPFWIVTSAGSACGDDTAQGTAGPSTEGGDATTAASGDDAGSTGVDGSTATGGGSTASDGGSTTGVDSSGTTGSGDGTTGAGDSTSSAESTTSSAISDTDGTTGGIDSCAYGYEIELGSCDVSWERRGYERPVAVGDADGDSVPDVAVLPTTG